MFLHCLAYFQEKYSCKANFTIATFHLFWTFSLEEFQSIRIWFKYLLQLSDIFLLKERLNATTVVRQPIRAARGKCILRRLVTNEVNQTSSYGRQDFFWKINQYLITTVHFWPYKIPNFRASQQKKIKGDHTWATLKSVHFCSNLSDKA